MSTELNMPQMGYDMQEGTVVRWLVPEGAEVKEGDPVAEIETDKAVVEFESYASGLLHRILVPEGTAVPVGQAIAIVAAEGEDLSAMPEADAQAFDMEQTPLDEPAEVEEQMEEEVPAVAEAPTPVEKAPAPAARLVRASPVARKLAEDKGIDLSQLVGTGPGGRITRDDVLAAEAAAPVEEPEPEALEEEAPAEEAAAEEPTAEEASVEEVAEEETSDEEALEEGTEDEAPEEEAPDEEAPVEEDEAPVEEEPEEDAAPETVEPETAPDEDLVPLTRMRQQISRVTVKSKQEKPHFYVSAEIDMTRAMEFRQQVNRDLESQGVKVTVNDLIIKACAKALGKHPKFNAYLEDDAIRLNQSINVGVAIAQEEGLIVPAIMDCGDKSLRDIASASKDLAARATSGSLQTQEYTGGTFAISNLGMFDVTSFAAIIHPPQTAVVAVGKVTKRPVVKDDEIAIAQMMTATLSADHRIVDGAEGAQFLIEIKEQLQNPLNMVV